MAYSDVPIIPKPFPTKIPKNQKIEQLEDLCSPELIAAYESDEYYRQWLQVGLTAGPRVERSAVVELLTLLELPCAHVLWAEEPAAGGRALQWIAHGTKASKWSEDVDITRQSLIDSGCRKPPPQAIQPFDGYCRWGQIEAYWVAFQLFCRADIPEIADLEKLVPVVLGASWWFYHPNDGGIAIMCPRFTSVWSDTSERAVLHCADGPVAFGRYYALQGIVLPYEYEWIVKEHETLTRAKIDTIDNAEIRRVTIATYPGAYVQGPPIQTDSYGQLFDLPGEEYRVVRVVDAHSPRVYWLRCPPDTRSAHEAVARSFGLTPQTYHPHVET